MKIARFWTRESLTFPWRDGEGETAAWGWSETSMEDARRSSLTATQRVVDWLVGGSGKLRGEYDYITRPAREEIVREIAAARAPQQPDPDAAPTAIVTRNAYGALVLNASRLMIADADLDRARDERAPSILARLFGRGKERGPSAEERLLAGIRSWVGAHPEIGLRLYRTAGGFRGIVTSEPIEATTERARTMLGDLSNDPLYRRLCEVQECFRARLSPKPWRIGQRPPGQRYPFPDAETRSRHRAWVEGYDRAAQRFATCRLVEQLGPKNIHPELAGLVALHDAETRAEEDLPLA